MDTPVMEMPAGQDFACRAQTYFVGPIPGATPLLPLASDGSGMNMPETRKPEKAQKIARGRDDQVTSTPALRHVGRTLESDPNYLENEQPDGNLTPEAQIANVGAPADSTMSRGATDLSADVSSTDDAAKARSGRNEHPRFDGRRKNRHRHRA